MESKVNTRRLLSLTILGLIVSLVSSLWQPSSSVDAGFYTKSPSTTLATSDTGQR